MWSPVCPLPPFRSFLLCFLPSFVIRPPFVPMCLLSPRFALLSHCVFLPWLSLIPLVPLFGLASFFLVSLVLPFPFSLSRGLKWVNTFVFDPLNGPLLAPCSLSLFVWFPMYIPFWCALNVHSPLVCVPTCTPFLGSPSSSRVLLLLFLPCSSLPRPFPFPSFLPRFCPRPFSPW